jgi:hypothetical protein
MGLSNFVRLPEVREKLAPLHPDRKTRLRQLRVPLQVPRRSQDSSLVGTAFDYLLRFELQRRAPHAIASSWMAEEAPTYLDSVLQKTTEIPSVEKMHEIKRQVFRALNNAKAAVANYVTRKSPTRSERAEIAIHAVQLAKLDRICWLSQFHLDLFHLDFKQTIPPELIEELLELLDIVPYGQLLDDHIMLLNPTFGQVGEWVFGATADLITGDLLLDIKTAEDNSIRLEYLNQILGYYLLARWQRRIDPSFPVIRRLGLYYARYGCLWCLEVSEWTRHPMFHATEEWLFQYARERFEAWERTLEALESLKRTAEMLETLERSLQPANPRGGTLARVLQRLRHIFTSFCRWFRFWDQRQGGERPSQRSASEAEEENSASR